MLAACPTRRIWFVFIAMLGLLASTSALPRAVVAQDDAAAGADEKVEKVGDAKQAARGKDTQSTLAWIVHTSGIIGGFLLILSIYFV